MNIQVFVRASCAVSGIVLLVWAVGQIRPDPAEVQSTLNDSGPAPTGRMVTLSSSKSSVAGIQLAVVRRGDLLIARTLPARITYDDSRHVSVRAATDGVLERVLVKPGDVVVSGQTIAVLRSPDIGNARSEVMTRTAALELAESERVWWSTLCENVKRLVDAIASNTPVDTIEIQFRNATLGEYRGKILAGYSKSLLASRLSASVGEIGQTGAVSGRIVQQRQSQQHQALAELNALMEQALFETGQHRKQSRAEAKTAERDLMVAKQLLSTLLGMTEGSASKLDPSGNTTDLARLEIRSPFSGTVERRTHSATERVVGGTELFVIADTSELWVEADVRGRDWNALQVSDGDSVIVTTPATLTQRLDAKVYFVGREVDSLSGAIPLVARIANPNKILRPGLFARMEVPVGTLRDVIVIHDSAIVDLDGQDSVFVKSENGYEPTAVQVGIRSGDRVEIRSGLHEGQSIVVDGAFVLKSEMLLEGEQ
ncbi:MAG: efflux RND transporter periplasmic adaptor subunit [Pirellulaceae bacterium]|nr:efflux RND transporter periplasmic adaptor subunit [Pirellulaceae bacterium]